MRPKELKRCVSNTHVSKTRRLKESVRRVPNIRRSLTITEGNDKIVQQRRAMFLGIRENPIDMDYTTAVNMLIELGDFLFSQPWTNPVITINMKDVLNIVYRYAYSTALKEEAIVDQYQDFFIRNFPKMVDLYQKAMEMQKQKTPIGQRIEQ
jgi:hypothetical protein